METANEISNKTDIHFGMLGKGYLCPNQKKKKIHLLFGSLTNKQTKKETTKTSIFKNTWLHYLLYTFT